MKKIEKINEIINRPLHTDGNSSPRIADNAFAEYEYYLFEDAIEFYKLNKIYFDEETLQKIKQLFMKELEEKNASDFVKNEVDFLIDIYIRTYHIKGEPTKAEFDDVMNLYYKCYEIVKQLTPIKQRIRKTEKAELKYYEIFKDRIDKILKDSQLIISGGDYYHLIFQVSLMCQIEHGDFYWVEELEHCCCDYVEAINDGKRFTD